MRLLIAIAVSFQTIAFVASAGAAGWFDPGWSHRQKITISPTLADDSLSDFPYLFEVTDPAAPVFLYAQPDGDDILFTAADGTTKLDHELRLFDAGGSHLIAWVRLPGLSATLGTEIYVYYGNDSAPPQQNPAATWDAAYVAVHHLDEMSGVHFDATSFDNDGVPSGNVVQGAGGRVGSADSFDGTTGRVEIADSPELRRVSMTLEAWVYIPTAIPAGFRTIVEHARSSNNWYGLWKSGNPGAEDRFHFRWSTGSVRRVDFSTPLSPNTWYYVAGTLDSTTQIASAYLNGNLDTPVSGASLPTPTAGLVTIGTSNAGSEPFIGTIDEVRISSVARSPSWIKACYRNQQSPASYQTLGHVEPLAITKRAFGLDGSPIPNLSTVPKGALIRFLLYVNNVGGVTTDVRLQDALDPGFAYVGGSIKYDNAVPRCASGDCSAAEEEAILASAVAGTPGTDASDGDVVRFASSTVYVGDQAAGNARLDIQADKVWAVVFTVRME